MTPFDLTVFAIKLAAGTLAFLLIGYFGSSNDKRVAGAMLTFPVLNGIGLVTSPDKDTAALTGAMMPMIALNGFLCFGFITVFQWLRARTGTASDRLLSYGVGFAGAAVWCLVAWLGGPWLESRLPASWVIAALYLIVTGILTFWLWAARPIVRAIAVKPKFEEFWRQRRWRIVFFVASMFLLLVAARIGDAGTVGRLSALPLVPLCVLCGLALDDREGLPALRDPIFLGPGLSMLFVLALTAVLIPLQEARGFAYWIPGTLALLAGWAVCFVAIRHGMPRLAAALDRVRGP
jgi:hypothetical protein